MYLQLTLCLLVLPHFAVSSQNPSSDVHPHLEHTTDAIGMEGGVFGLSYIRSPIDIETRTLALQSRLSRILNFCTEMSDDIPLESAMFAIKEFDEFGRDMNALVTVSEYLSKRFTQSEWNVVIVRNWPALLRIHQTLTEDILVGKAVSRLTDILESGRITGNSDAEADFEREEWVPSMVGARRELALDSGLEPLNEFEPLSGLKPLSGVEPLSVSGAIDEETVHDYYVAALNVERTFARRGAFVTDPGVAAVFETSFNAIWQLRAAQQDPRPLMNSLARLLGYQGYGPSIRVSSALMEYERSRGRPEESALPEFNPLARLLQAVVSEMSAFFDHSWKVTTEEVRSIVAAPYKGRFATLRQVLNAFCIMAKSFLGFDIRMDRDPSVSSPSFIVLQVSRGQELVGRMFLDFSDQFGLSSEMHSVTCSTRDGAAASGSVILGISHKHGHLASEVDSKGPLDGLYLSLDEMRHTFHEFGHGIHCLSGRTVLDGLTMRQGSLDYVELPSHLFEYFARDLFEFIVEGRTIADPPVMSKKSIPGFKLLVAYSVEDYCADMENPDDCDLRYLLGNSEADRTSLETISLVATHSYHGQAYGYTLTRVVSMMVYWEGDFRRKLWRIAEQYNQIVGDLVDPEESDQLVDPEESDQLVDTLEFPVLKSELKMREFFASRAVEVGFDKFFDIAPGLLQKLEKSSYFDQVLDFDIVKSELSLDVYGA